MRHQEALILMRLDMCRGVTIEYQRKQAKEMQNYFKSQKAAKTIEKSK